MNEEDMQQRNEQGQYYHTKSVKKINSIEKDRSIEYHELPVPTLAENRIAQGVAEVGSSLSNCNSGFFASKHSGRTSNTII